MTESRLKVVLIIQDDPFVLPNILPKFLNSLGDGITIEAALILSHSPTPKKENSLLRARRIISIFGFRFFAYYLAKFIRAKISYKSVQQVLRGAGVNCFHLRDSINNPMVLEEIRTFEPDVLVSVLGSEIFKEELLSIAPCLNLHTAMLPKYRGLMPTFWVLKNNEKSTGVSVFWVNEGIDAGPIVKQREVSLADNPSQKQLIEFTKRVGLDLMSEALREFHDGALKTTPNDENQSTYYGFPDRNDVKLFLENGKRFF